MGKKDKKGKKKVNDTLEEPIELKTDIPLEESVEPPISEDIQDGLMAQISKVTEKLKEKEKKKVEEAQVPQSEATPGDNEDEAESKSKNKKKKKPKKKEEKKEEEKKPKKKGPNVAALRAVLEAQRLAEEEERRKEEEEKERIEEEKKRIKEEARRKEEAKRIRKEKEKAKREQLKKEGKLLTKTQKTKQQQAQLRLQQMIDSGNLKVEGLTEKDIDNKPKKIVYENKKKKPAKQMEDQKKDEEATTKEPEEQVDQTVSEEKIETIPAEETGKESWEDVLDRETDEDEIASTSKKEEEEEDEEEEEEEESSTEEEESKADESKLKAPTKKPVQPSKSHPSTTAKDQVKKTEKPAEAESSETETDEEDSEDEGSAETKRKQEAMERRKKRHEEALAARSKDNLRSPICCILGHVDTGKTKLLDKIRQTNVQEDEAGGITQQIGATYFPMETVKIKTAPLNKDGKQEYKLPGLLVIDTPGHESFTNLRSRGSSLCNIAILVVDIMHGLEPQTLESLRLLRDRKSPFIVALNKIDRIFGWKPIPDNGFLDSLEKQSASAKREFRDRVEKTIVAFAEQGLNSCLYYENKNFAKIVSLVPTSAITGEGIPDMLMLLVNLTQTRMADKLMYLSELECTVLEVKVIDGLGTTIDVILSNGVLNEGDRIVLCGLNGPISTTVRALLTPEPLRELRVKSAYVHHKSVKAALGIKISAQDLEKAIAGSRLMVVGPDDDEDEIKDEVMSDLKSLFNAVDKSGRGVCVQASTLGSLEALLEFLRTSKIPVSGINIGPVHRKDIMRCAAMLEKAKELSVILCFDVKIDKEAQDLADELGVKIFKADIIYHLFDQFIAYNKDILEQKRKDQAPQAVFPCILKIIPGSVFNKRDPIIVGVDVVEGVLRTGTPICVAKVNPATNTREVISLGKVSSIEQNHKSIDVVKKGQAGAGVAIKLECPVYDNPKTVGRHFTETDELYSRITRQSIDIMKESFRNDLTKEEWALIVRLKKLFDIN